MTNPEERQMQDDFRNALRDDGATLDLHGRGLKLLPFIPLDPMRLRKLDLSGNRLQALPDWLWQLARLEQLDLGGNRLRELDPRIGQLGRLEVLDLSENRLATLPAELAACTRLVELELFGNLIAQLPGAVLALPALRRLDLSGNRMEALPALAEGSLPLLEGLDLRGNPIQVMPATWAALAARSSAAAGGAPGEAEASDIRRRLLERVSGGYEPGVRYFDAPAFDFGFKLVLPTPTVAKQSVDLYYKDFGEATVGLRLGNGMRVDLSRLGRKAAHHLLEAQGTPVMLEFGSTNQKARADANVALAQRALVQRPAATMVGPESALPPPAGAAPGEAPAVAAPEAGLGFEAPSPPAAEPRLHFVLQGKYARGSAICAHRKARLVFRLDLPPADALAIVENAALDAARRGDADISLQLSARGDLEVVGERIRIARFRAGALREPVSFSIEAGLAGREGSALHVDFIVKGETVHQAELPIRVVAKLPEPEADGAAALGPQALAHSLLDDAEGIEPPPPQRIEMGLSFDRGRFRIDLRHLQAGRVRRKLKFVSKDIERSRIEALLKAVRGDLAAAYADEIFWSAYEGAPPAEGPEARVAEAALGRTLAAIAAAGSRLNASLRSDAEIAKALDYVQDMAPDGAVLTVLTDTIFLPWELLYPRFRSPNMSPAQKAANPIVPEDFWGLRFAVETVQRKGDSAPAALRRTQIEAPPQVSINLNATIAAKAGVSTQPIAQQQAWAERLRAAGRLDGLQERCGDMRRVLQDGRGRATLIYVYCHGSSPNPFGGEDELLTLGDNCPLRPIDLGSGDRYASAPIVFLNACQTAAHSPLTFSNFLSEFRQRGALGMIATSYSVPIVFGAAFGEAVVEGYLRRSGSLAVAMQALRREHLLQRGNPVPLFYSLQCQLSFPVP
jgi:hypothetical protein